MRGLLAVIGIIVLIVMFLLPTYFLWNWLMPAIFGIKKITVLQALGILILSEILFKARTGGKEE